MVKAPVLSSTAGQKDKITAPSLASVLLVIGLPLGLIVLNTLFTSFALTPTLPLFIGKP